MTTDTAHDATAHDRPDDGTRTAPLFADLDAIVRGLVQTYPLLTLAGAMLGGYVAARLARRVR